MIVIPRITGVIIIIRSTSVIIFIIVIVIIIFGIIILFSVVPPVGHVDGRGGGRLGSFRARCAGQARLVPDKATYITFI